MGGEEKGCRCRCGVEVLGNYLDEFDVGLNPDPDAKAKVDPKVERPVFCLVFA